MAKSSHHSKCRLCGSDNGIMISMLEPKHEKYLQKISNLLHIAINVNDPLPKVLCHRCAIKIDDFQAFVDRSHATQIVLNETFYPHKEPNEENAWTNHQSSLLSNVNGLSLQPSFDSVAEPLPEINPPEIIQLNLLTYSISNSNSDSFVDTRAKSIPNISVPRSDLELVNNENGKEITPVSPSGKPFGPRRGSRPFPKKLGPTSSITPEPVSRSSSSDIELLPNATETTAVEGEEKRRDSSENEDDEESQYNQESSTAGDKDALKSKSSNSSLTAKKKKKYLSPFEVPSRKRKRHNKKPNSEKKPVKESNKIHSSSDEETPQTVKKLSSIPEEDLKKYFILTRIPDAGLIYTCQKCETIFTTAKAACSHTKCLNGDQTSEDENSSSSESSDAEPSDTSKSDAIDKESIYQCSYCGKPFTRNVVRLQHEQIHLRDLSDDAEETYVAPKQKKKPITNRFLVEKFFLR